MISIYEIDLDTKAHPSGKATEMDGCTWKSDQTSRPTSWNWIIAKTMTIHIVEKLATEGRKL